MSGREKIWFDNRVIWIHLPDDIEEEEESKDLWAELILALECLTKKQRFVIECRHGLRRGSFGKVWELEDLAMYMGTTKQAVKRIEDRAILRMQDWAEKVD